MIRGLLGNCKHEAIRTLNGSSIYRSCSSMSDKRGRRVLFNVPGSDERKLKKTLSLDLDVVVLDLEDGVAPNRKKEARDAINSFLTESTYPSHTERSIRMNHVGSGLEHDDINHCIIPSLPHLDSVLIPKVETSDQLRLVGWHLVKALQKNPRTEPFQIIAAIETAKGILNLEELCKTILPRQVKLTGLVYASEDLCADMGLTRTPEKMELMYTRQRLVCVAKAYGLDAIDLVCIDFKDEEILFKEALGGSQMGFIGKQAIHPNQIDTIYKAFNPSEKEIAFATEIVEGFARHSEEGKGAFVVNDKMIDMPMVKWAEGVLKLVR